MKNILCLLVMLSFAAGNARAEEKPPVIKPIKLMPSDIKTLGEIYLDSFGTSVAIDEDLIVVGAHTVNGNTGVIYIYVWDKTSKKWVGSKYAPKDTKNTMKYRSAIRNLEFGRFVAVDGNTIVVGASNSFYILKLDKNKAVVREQREVPITKSGVGYLVYPAIKNKKIMVLACQDSGFDGSIFTYRPYGKRWKKYNLTGYANAVSVAENGAVALGSRREGVMTLNWNSSREGLKKLYVERDGINDLLGKSIATNGKIIVAGAPHVDHKKLSWAGRVHIYYKNGKSKVLKEYIFRAPTPSYSEKFGSTVAIADNLFAVGSCNTTNRARAIYIYSWENKAKHLCTIKSPAPKNAEFARSLAMNNNWVVVGSKKGVYVYSLKSFAK